jgi:uncharacterized protein
MLNKLMLEMTKYYSGDPHSVQHFIKVHAFSRYIAQQTGLDPETLFTLEAAAYTHDVGIKPAREKYGSADGPLQEKEGPAMARPMLEKLGFDEKTIRRVCWLIAHHHTYAPVDGMDHRILIEADFLVNLFEGGASRDAVRTAYEKMFVTDAGKELCREMFAL